MTRICAAVRLDAPTGSVVLLVRRSVAVLEGRR